MNYPSTQLTTRGLRRLFPTAKFGTELIVHREGDTVVGVTAPSVVTPEQILDAANRTAVGVAPSAVGKGQLYAALVSEGWFANTEAADATFSAILAALPETKNGAPFREVMRALFLKASTVQPNNELVEIIRTQLSKSTAERDALFWRAATF